MAVFPEGKSSDVGHLQHLDKGFTRMALESAASPPDHATWQVDDPLFTESPAIVPVALHYFPAHAFRSRAVVEFGHPVTVSPTILNMYTTGDVHGAQTALLNEIGGQLDALMATSRDHKERTERRVLRRLYQRVAVVSSWEEYLDLTRLVRRSHDLLRAKGDQTYMTLVRDALQYDSKIFKLTNSHNPRALAHALPPSCCGLVWDVLWRGIIGYDSPKLAQSRTQSLTHSARE